jgi:hypothetical protein
MPLSPPAPASQGQAFWVSLAWTDTTTGLPADPAQVTAVITYPPGIALTAIAGPWIWDGSSSVPAPGTVWRTGTGAFTAWWDTPPQFPGGDYTVTWTVVYDGDTYYPSETFTVSDLPATPVPATDTGLWTGGLAYTPPYSSQPLTIPFGQVDDSGVAWMLQKVQGWDSPPVAVGQVIQRSADHGGYATAQYYGPRVLTLTVWASAPDQATRDAARALLQAAVPVSQLGVFEYDEPIPKIAYVRRNAAAQVQENLIDRVNAQFVIPLVAPDPRKYAVTASSASSLAAPAGVTPLALPFTSGFPVTFPGGIPPGNEGITAVNEGTFETRPLITVTGPVTAPAIVNGATGQAISFSGLTLGPADQLVINTDTRQAYLNGVFQPADPSSSWWVLWPGTSTIFMQGTGMDGSVLSATWSSAWM